MSDTPAYDSLSFKRRRFVDAYLETWNATRAAEEAGYRNPRQLGSRQLSKVDVQAAIRDRMKAKSMRADEVLHRLAEQGRNEVSLYIREDGTVDLPAIVRDGKQRLIKGIKYNQRGQMMVEFFDAQAALVQIGKAEQIFHENELNVDVQESRVNIYVPDNGRNPSTT